MSVDKSGERVQTMFGEIAPRYDFLNHFLSGGVDYAWRRKTVRTVSPQGTAPILDVCTGTGDLALAYWKRGEKKVPVVGTDFTHEMLVHARKKAEKLKDPAAPQFLQADTMQLPFEDDLFQIVSVAFGLRNVSNTMDGLREMVRVCQSGGRVAVLEFSQPSNRMFRGAYNWYSRRVLPRVGQMLAPNRQAAYNYLPDSVAEFPHGAELAKLMEDAGLTDMQWKPLTFGIATLYYGVKP